MKRTRRACIEYLKALLRRGYGYRAVCRSGAYGYTYIELCRMMKILKGVVVHGGVRMLRY